MPTTLVDMIVDNLNIVERAHGTVLVSRALGYLSCTRGGLSQTELIGVISSDQDVLNEVG